MEKKKVTAVVLAGLMASIGLGGLHAAADEVVLETESTETIIPEDAGLTHEKQVKLKRGKHHHRNSGGVFWQD